MIKPMVMFVSVVIACFAGLVIQNPRHVISKSIQRHLENLLIPAVPVSTVVDFDCSNSLTVASLKTHLTNANAVKGFHVLCLTEQKSDHSHTLQGVVYYEGTDYPSNPIIFEVSYDLGTFRSKMEKLLHIKIPEGVTATKYQQPWAIFSPEGQRLEYLSQFKNKITYVFDGGQFIWPGIEIGHKRVVKDLSAKGDVIMETLSMIPLVFSVEEFLKDEEIEVILDLSKEHLAPSGVTHMDGHEGRPATEWRTSTTYFLPSVHEVVKGINKRTEDLVKVPESHQEDVQVLRYESTQKYDHHTDYFPTEHHQNNPAILDSIHHGYKNRMITVFWYMSTVEKGGHTIFPRAGGLPQPPTMNDCSKGLKVSPLKRKVVVFYSMLANGEGDPMSLHGGCPVEEGIKYSGNKWVWNKPRD